MQRFCILLALTLGLSSTLSYLVMWVGIARQGGMAYCGEFYPSGWVMWVEWHIEPWVLTSMVIVEVSAILGVGASMLRKFTKRT